MALLQNAFFCHFRIPIPHKRLPDRSGHCSCDRGALDDGYFGCEVDPPRHPRDPPEGRSLPPTGSLRSQDPGLGEEGRVEIDFLHRLRRRMIQGINICPG